MLYFEGHSYSSVEFYYCQPSQCRNNFLKLALLSTVTTLSSSWHEDTGQEDLISYKHVLWCKNVGSDGEKIDLRHIKCTKPEANLWKHFSNYQMCKNSGRISLYLSISVCLPLSLSLSLTLFVSLSFGLSLYLFLSASQYVWWDCSNRINQNFSSLWHKSVAILSS